MNWFLLKLFGFFKSLKLAVFLILSLGTILAIGTIYEAKYGTDAAQRAIYHSWPVSLEMVLLVLNLACAAMDRWPWKKHHVGFVVTHAGLITLIFGSFLTQQKGLDGSIALSEGQVTDSVLVPDLELQVYQALGGRPFALLEQRQVSFANLWFLPSRLTVPLINDDKLVPVEFLQKAKKVITVKSSDSLPGSSALKFRLHGANADFSEWLGESPPLPSQIDLGRILITFSPERPQGTPDRNQIAFFKDENGGLSATLYSPKTRETEVERNLVVGQDYVTGWMDFKITVTDYQPHSKGMVNFSMASDQDPSATTALLVDIGGERMWLELDSPKYVRAKGASYFINLTRRRYDLGFSMQLDHFNMGHYGGSRLPSSYESIVLVDGRTREKISMNEPLKREGYTVYQASYETNDQGEPTASIFAVNYDPGRPVKYTGALGIVIGIGLMFYWKPLFLKRMKG